MAYTKQQILGLLYHQLENFFFLTTTEKTEIENCIDKVLKRCEINFQSSDNKYYKRGFNPTHSVMNMIFLYYMSHELYKRNECPGLCDKVYYLNKIMNSVDLFYAIELPDKFGAEHPIGSVMGRAKYENNFYFYQNCTVGGTGNLNQEVYPAIGHDVTMYANSSIIGNCKIGNYVKIGAGCIVKNQDIPDNSIVFGESPNLIIKSTSKH